MLRDTESRLLLRFASRARTDPRLAGRDRAITVRMARIAVALACAASCCAMFTVNERAAHTDAHVKPMDTVGRLITLDERPREMTITPARVCVVIEDKRAGCSCIAGGERAADAEDAEQTPVR